MLFLCWFEIGQYTKIAGRDKKESLFTILSRSWSISPPKKFCLVKHICMHTNIFIAVLLSGCCIIKIRTIFRARKRALNLVFSIKSFCSFYCCAVLLVRKMGLHGWYVSCVLNLFKIYFVMTFIFINGTIFALNWLL